jgi:hypothetical protein
VAFDALGAIPTGGATGQVLGKVSGTNYDTAWNPQTSRLRTFPVLDGATSYKTVPGSTLLRGMTGTNGFVAGRVNYQSWLVESPMILTAIETVVATAAAGSEIVFVLYPADEKWQPVGAPIASSGALDSSTTGIKTGTLTAPVTLAVGRYVLLFAGRTSDSLLMRCRSFDAGLPNALSTSGTDVNAFLDRFRGDSTLRDALFSSPPTNPAKATNNGVFSTLGDSHIGIGVFSA